MGLEPAGYQSLSGKEHATSGKVTVNPFDLSTGFQPGDVISYIEMCGAIGVNLQRIPLTSTGLLMEGDSAQNKDGERERDFTPVSTARTEHLWMLDT